MASATQQANAIEETAPPPVDGRPIVTLKRGTHKRALTGHPWIYSNEVVMDVATKAIAPGTVVSVKSHEGRPVGSWFFNPRPLISLRFLSDNPTISIDSRFLSDKLRSALQLRERIVSEPYYRLVHAEADGIPGLILDRFGDTVVVQANCAGIDTLSPDLLTAIDDVVAPRAVVARNDSAGRVAEGLPASVSVPRGNIDGPISLIENGATFSVDPLDGQKTGWFFDQRENRAMVAELARGARVLDLYCYAGGFAVQAALGGASQVIAVDRSAAALERAEDAAIRNGVADRCKFEKAEVFARLESLAAEKELFDIVICDPPAFVKSRRDLHQGLRGYHKLTRLAARLVRPGGFLFAASCSHNVDQTAFGDEVRKGVRAAGRSGRILRMTGAAADHPLHPWLPESGYLKALLLALD